MVDADCLGLDEDGAEAADGAIIEDLLAIDTPYMSQTVVVPATDEDGDAVTE